MAYDPFVAYQYFLHVVPTTYVPPRSKPLNTNQYSVTHYTRVLDHHRGTPGIFFKFDLEPLHLTIHQRTTTLTQFLIRVVGVVGGVFVCMGYAVKIGSHAMDAVTGADHTNGIVAAESTSISANLRKRFNASDLRLRSGKDRVVRQGSGWVVEGGSPYGSYANTPVSGMFNNGPQASASPYSPGFAGSPNAPPSDTGTGMGTTPRSPSYGHGHGHHTSFAVVRARAGAGPGGDPPVAALAAHARGVPVPDCGDGRDAVHAVARRGHAVCAGDAELVRALPADADARVCDGGRRRERVRAAAGGRAAAATEGPGVERAATCEQREPEWGAGLGEEGGLIVTVSLGGGMGGRTTRTWDMRHQPGGIGLRGTGRSRDRLWYLLHCASRRRAQWHYRFRSRPFCARGGRPSVGGVFGMSCPVVVRLVPARRGR